MHERKGRCGGLSTRGERKPGVRLPRKSFLRSLSFFQKKKKMSQVKLLTLQAAQGIFHHPSQGLDQKPCLSLNQKLHLFLHRCHLHLFLHRGHLPDLVSSHTPGGMSHKGQSHKGLIHSLSHNQGGLSHNQGLHQCT